MITADQLLLHLIGDYPLQSTWMAQRKTAHKGVALAHSLVYGALFWLIAPTLFAWLVIVLSHAVIDHYGLARYVCYASQYLSPPWTKDGLLTTRNRHPWSACHKTGYHTNAPPYLSTWLFIIVDNVIHITINGIALRYL